MAGNSTEDLFGDSSLFQQFENGSQSTSEDSDEEEDESKDKVGEYEEEISKLRRENQQLKQRLRLLIKGSNAVINNAGRDGPIAQIVYMNSDIIKIHQQDIEDFMTGLALKGQQLKRDQKNTDKMQPHPQNSAIVLEKDQKTTDASIVKSRQAFTAIGNVQYYSDFCIDQLGKPLIDWNPQLTLNWDIPTYTQVFTEALPIVDDGSKPRKRQRVKACCFNCGGEDHSLRECTQPRDMAKINQNRQNFMTQFGNSPRSNRYHKDGEELVKKFPQIKPGIISDSLREALGIANNCLPPYIYQMRIHGYPPGYLKEAEEESSGLIMYNQPDKVTTQSGDELETGELQEESRPVYDPSKIIEYPGFNVPLPEGAIDEAARFNMPPMQPHQSKEVLQLYFSPSSTEVRKRERTDDGGQRASKRQKIERRVEHDMELDSGTGGEDTDTSIHFKPPLPSDAPSNMSLPPLPTDTPPSTPGRTPRRVASYSALSDVSSAANSGHTSRCTTPELEELEAKQLLLLKELEAAEDDGTTDKDTDKDTDRETDRDDATTDKDTDKDDATTDRDDDEDDNDTGMSLIIGGEEFHVTDSVQDTEDAQRSGKDTAMSEKPHASEKVKEEQNNESKTNDTVKETEPVIDNPVNTDKETNNRTSDSNTATSTETNGNQISNGKSLDKESVESPAGIDMDTSQPGTPASDTASRDSGTLKSLKGIPDAKNFASGISPYKPHENEKQISGVYKKLRQIIKKIPKE